MTLSLHNVSCRIGNTHIVGGVTFQVAPGSVLGLIGSNGAGKTTLARCCAGLLAPSTGQVTLGGEPLAGHSTEDRSRQIAYLPQDNRIHWPVNVRAIVELGRMPHASDPANSPARDEAAIDTALEQLELKDLEERPVTKLSGGERRRVLIARTLAQQPRYLLADEPTVGLDPGHRLDLFRLFVNLARDRNLGLLIVLHDLSAAARHCDELVLLANGGVLSAGKPKQVLTEANLATAFGVSSRIDFSGDVPVVNLLDTISN